MHAFASLMGGALGHWQGCDCLGYIKYFDAHLTNFFGGVDTIENCICMHEEDHGILWKHQDWRSGLAEVRRSRRLTLSFICTIANYEYGFFWHFDQVIKLQLHLQSILFRNLIRKLVTALGWQDRGRSEANRDP